MGALDNILGQAEAAKSGRDLKTVVSYKADIARDSKGNPGFTLRPVLADGSIGRFGDLWIRLAEGPTTLRAFRASLPAVLAAIDKLDQYMVGAGEWPAEAKSAAAPKPAAKAPTPPAKAAPAPAKPADPFADLPF